MRLLPAKDAWGAKGMEDNIDNKRPFFTGQILVWLLQLFSAVLVAPAAEAMTIARNGRPAAVIATGANPPATTLFAANELASYLGRMVGAPFTIITNDPPAEGDCILVGEPCKDARFDEIRLRIRDGRILDLTGQQPRGPLYAVYEFLERQGCGFWSDFNETVPERKDIAVEDNLNYAYAPPFTLRFNSAAPALANAKWNPKARLNGNGRIPQEMGGSFVVDMRETSLDLNYGELARNCFAEHPEWYSLARPRGGGPMQRSPGQLCFSNPEVREKLAEIALEKLSGNRGLRTLSCSYADAIDACACSNCSAIAKSEGSKSAILLTGVNAVARAVARDYPDVDITFLAYGSNSIYPPRSMGIEPNVACVYAHLARDYAKPPSGTNLVARWLELTHGKVYIYGYGAMFHNYLMPAPTVDLFGPEMRFYRDCGVLGVSSQLSPTTLSDCADLRCWLHARMAWNPDRDEWEEIDRWCDGALGAGSPFVKEWLRLERDYRPNIRYLGPYEKDSRVCLSPELLLRGHDLFREALAATDGDQRTHGQLERMFASILSAMVARYNFDIADLVRRQGRTDIPDRDGLFNEFYDLCRRYKGDWMGEGEGRYPNRVRHGEILRVINPATGKAEIPPWTFRNPVSKRPVQDPFVTWDEATGFYYLLSSDGDRVDIRRARNAAKLADSEEVSVAWRPAAGGKGTIAGNVTAPELHRGDDGSWYIYASGSDGIPLHSSFSGGEDDIDMRDMGLGDETPATAQPLKSGANFKNETDTLEYRMFVLRSKTVDPFGGFDFAGILDDKVSALDPTVFRGPDGTLYLAYAQQGQGTSIMVRPMKDWTTVDGALQAVPIVAAHGQGEVFEAPSFFTHCGRLFLFYSSGGRRSEACRLEVRECVGDDVCRNASWGGRKARNLLVSGNQIETRAASRDRLARCLGPGHASFFPSPDGRQLWCAYHGMRGGGGDALMFEQQVDFDDAGTPFMGQPEIDTENAPATFLIIPSGEPGQVCWTASAQTASQTRKEQP